MFGDHQQTFDLLNEADMSSLNKTTISQATISGVAGNLNAFDLRGQGASALSGNHTVRQPPPAPAQQWCNIATRWKAITSVKHIGPQ